MPEDATSGIRQMTVFFVVGAWFLFAWSPAMHKETIARGDLQQSAGRDGTDVDETSPVRMMHPASPG